MAFKEVQGQEKAVELLKNGFAGGRLAHAYLFHGPEGVGKELAAKSFAKLLNCRSPENGDACDTCESCVRTQKGTHPDVLWLRPRGKGCVIPIGERLNPVRGTVREFRMAVGMKPYMGRWKVGIFSEAHALQRDAANALLKTLEEPPAHTVIILVTSRPEMLLPTIVSRCQAVRFEPMPEEALARILRSEHSLPAGEAALLSRLTGGRLGESVQALREGRLQHSRELAGLLASGGTGYWNTVARPIELMERSLARAVESLEWELAEKGLRAEGSGASAEEMEDLVEAFVAGETRRKKEEMLKELLTWYRDLMVWRETGDAKLILSAAGGDAVAQAAQRTAVERIGEALRRIEHAHRALRFNADFHTVVENLLVQITGEGTPDRPIA